MALYRIAICTALVFVAPGSLKPAIGQAVAPAVPKLAPGQYLLPNGWALSPAGRQIDLGGLPLKLLPVPKSNYVIAMSNGYTEHFVGVIDVDSEKLVQRLPIGEGWMGVAVSADGRQVFVSAGGKDQILIFTLEGHKLSAAGQIELPAGTFPAGLHLGRGGQRLYVTANLGNALLVVDPAERAVKSRVAVGNKPYACLVTADEKTAYVSNWGEDSVAVIELATSKVTNIKVQDRPNDLVMTRDEKYLFVPNGNRNTVSVIDTVQQEVIEQIDVAVEAKSPPGSTPNALVLSPDEETLYVANADNNAIAVIEVEEKGHSQPRGFIPTGWYPTTVCFAADGKKLIVANGKGSLSSPNRLLGKDAKTPGRETLEGRTIDYIGRLLEGTLSFVELPQPQQLAEYSQQVHRNSPQGRAEAAKAPFELGEKCPIQHVFYIIKENRTYDCIFGDMPQGNGDPEYCLFPLVVTPNHHALAEQFVLFDNFYHSAEVSADGHHWVTSAYATDYVEKFWPSMYSGKGQKRLDLHDDQVAFSRAGFLWDLCAKAGISYRSYGEFARIRGAEPGHVHAAMPSLEGHIHTTYYGADGIAAMSDSKRLELWLEEFRKFEAAGEMPRFTVLSLPGDHLVGTRPGAQTPRAMMAENDWVLGQMIAEIAKSRFWSSTAIFVVEDDAQNGPDHVDCHRTVGLIVSPYTRRQAVDSTMYSSSSMLRTMEMILGLPPLTQHDAYATPMWAAFQAKADLRQYDGLAPTIPLDEKNTADAFGAKHSEELTLEEADTADDNEYNIILWKAVQGADSPLPPRHVAAFVLERAEADEDDDD